MSSLFDAARWRPFFMNDDPGDATGEDTFRRVLTEHARLSAERFLTVRVYAVLAWLAVCLGFGVFGDRLDLRANAVPVAAYLALACGLLVASRSSRRAHRWSVAALVLLDVPAIFFIQYQGVPLSPSPEGTAGFSVGILSILLVTSVLTMRARNVIGIAALLATLEAILMARGHMPPGSIAAALAVFGTLATLGAYTTRQVWALMEGVSQEEIKVAEAQRSHAAMLEQVKQAGVLARMNEDLQASAADLQRTLEELRRAQAELVRAERMASVATLVKGIAHELNNPIGFIAGNMGPLQRYSEFLVRVATELADGRPRTTEELAKLTRLTEKKDLRFVADDLSRLTADISEGARRARLIISDLQGLTNASQRGLERVDLHKVVRQTMTLLSARVPAGVKIETDLQPVPELVARAGQLEQVLVNLVDNAIRAVGEHGVLTVRVAPAEGKIALSVSDDGAGMSPEVQRSALEPFFTTRGPGEGSGLGLAIVASIVRGHRGTLALRSEPSHGTAVLIELPLEGLPLPDGER